jgi:hypothetical protein
MEREYNEDPKLDGLIDKQEKSKLYDEWNVIVRWRVYKLIKTETNDRWSDRERKNNNQIDKLWDKTNRILTTDG